MDKLENVFPIDEKIEIGLKEFDRYHNIKDSSFIQEDTQAYLHNGLLQNSNQSNDLLSD